MNWRSIWLRNQLWQVALLGAMSGIWCALAHEGVLGLAMGLWGSGVVAAMLPGAAFGAVLGATVAPLDEFLGHFPRRALRSLGLGALLGALGGLVTLGPLGLLVPLSGASPAVPLTEGALWYWVLFSPALGVVAAAAGAASGLAVGQPRLGLRRAAWGFLGGMVPGAALAAGFAFLASNSWLHLAALAAWGALLAVTVFWREKRFARHWLRLLTGPGEDRILPLQGRELRLGKLESNEIPLPFYQEIHPVHCQMRWTGEHFQIIDDESGGTIMVNFRQVQEQVLKAGDLVKIGSALLQYGEAS
jgi:hypothetical protein